MDSSVLDTSVASSMVMEEVEDTEEESGAGAGGQHGLQQSRRLTQTNRKPRTKGLVKKLQQQIDFYFGDSNLSKDKFLQQKMKEDPKGYIAVDVIAGFKKMRTLSEDLSLIKKAMDNSSIVELSEDRERVRRSKPLPQMDTSDIDSRTIYVENLPSHLSDHETIKKLFKMFGTITYVSLPRHKTSGVAKGFAFIEFSTSEEASAALEFFKNKESQQQQELSKTRKLSTVVSQEDGAMESSSATTAEHNDGDGGSKVMEGAGGGETERGGQKRKREEEEDTLDSSEQQQLPATKRTRTTSPFTKDQASTTIHLHGDEKTPPTSSSDQKNTNQRRFVSADSTEKTKAMTSSVEPGNYGDGGQVIGKRKRRSCDDEEEGGVTARESQSEEPPIKSSRLDSQSSETDGLDETEGGVATDDGGGGVKKKKKNRQHKKKQPSSLLKDLDIRVMAKSEWSELKKVYCDLQKDHMKQLKKDLQATSEREGGGRREVKGFVGRCLVKVECAEEGGANVNEIKEACSRHGRVAYVDIKDGDKEGYVRYGVSGCVEKLLESDTTVTNTTFSAVSEEDERAYFLKCQAQRKQQFKTRGKKNQRGQDKLVSKALKKFSHDSKQPSHVRFSDNDDDS